MSSQLKTRILVPQRAVRNSSQFFWFKPNLSSTFSAYRWLRWSRPRSPRLCLHLPLLLFHLCIASLFSSSSCSAGPLSGRFRPETAPKASAHYKVRNLSFAFFHSPPLFHWLHAASLSTGQRLITNRFLSAPSNRIICQSISLANFMFANNFTCKLNVHK